ncbi:MAG: hypothetical protein AAGF87_14470, partial [Bacteroidota bacterium]
MRWLLSYLLACSVWSFAYAQPMNDDCVSAQFIDMGAELDCDGTRSISISGTTIDAAPTDPFPDHDCGGTSPSDISPDVWFAFTAPANSFTINATSDDINSFFMVVYSGTDCNSLAFRACDIGTPAGLVVSTIPGDTYFVFISGGAPDDFGDFDLEFEWVQDCAPCFNEQSGALTVSPPPTEGFYACGQEVQMCFDLTDWTTSGSLEWFHSLVPTFGPGWDLSTVQVVELPQSCSNDGGFWDWYPAGWSNCRTGEVFPMGFAYESGEGNAAGACAGFPGDGNPGNNWGDGLGCTDLNFPEIGYTFCWTMSVKACPPGSNTFTGEDLSVVLEVNTDGDSGSWNSVGCNDGTTFDQDAQVIVCGDQMPEISLFNPSCPILSDGSIIVEHDSLAISIGFFNYYLTTIENDTLESCQLCPNVQVYDNLPGGQYIVTYVNLIDDCTRSEIIDLPADAAPIATIAFDPSCPGTDLELQGNVDLTGVTEWSWFLADTLYANTQTLITADTGLYELLVIVDNCPSDTISVNAQYLPFEPALSVTDTTPCIGSDITFSAQGGTNYTWTGPNGPIFGADSSLTISDVAPEDSGNYVVTIQDSVTGCFQSFSQEIDTLAVPEIMLTAPTPQCVGATTIISASGADSYIWQDDLSIQNPREFVSASPGPRTLTVEGTGASGCATEASIDLFFNLSPTASLNATDNAICAGSGESITLVAGGGTVAEWSVPETGPVVTVNPIVTTEYWVIVENTIGCQDSAFIEIEVVEEPDLPTVFCQSTTDSSVVFGWTDTGGASDSVVVLTGQTGQINGNSFTVNGLAEGESVDIQLIVQSPPGTCPDVLSSVQTCTSLSCHDLQINIDNDTANYCIDDLDTSVVLTATITNEINLGPIQWLGPGVLSNVFSPAAAGLGDHLIIATVTDEGCAFADTVVFRVLEPPVAVFSLSEDTICQSELIEVSFDGTISPTTTYDWDFGGASVLTGTSAGPYQLFVTNPGTFYIELVVSDYGCSSPAAIDSFFAQPLLDAVVINCDNSTPDQVTFSWDPISDADSFLITINSTSAPPVFQDSLTYTVNNLMEGDDVTIFVTPLAEGFCSPITATTCVATSCPDLSVILPSEPVPFCIDQDPVMLSGTPNNGNGGTVVWSGPGVTNDVFDPVDAGIGLHTIIFFYEEAGPCILIDSFQIEVFPLPESSFTIDASSACIDQTILVTYTGTAGDDADFFWDFGAAATINQPDPNIESYELTYSTEGTFLITLDVVDNGCNSAQTLDSVTISLPLGQVDPSCGPNGLNESTVDWTYSGSATLFEVAVGSVVVDTVMGGSY